MKYTPRTKTFILVFLLFAGIALLVFVLARFSPAQYALQKISKSPLLAISRIFSSQESVNMEPAEKICSDFLTAEYERLKEEHEKLLQELDLKKNIQQKTIIGEVIGRGRGLPQAIILVNKGRKDGIEKGWYVMSQNQTVGIVSEVREELSWVYLFNHPDVKIMAEIVGIPDIRGLLSGNEIATSLSLTLIPQYIPVKEGDIVIATEVKAVGEGSGIVGTITARETDSEGLFQNITVTPVVDYATIRFVTFVKTTYQE